jgi:ubiquinone/menaquinone biosynthesis C-methylase UbiE
VSLLERVRAWRVDRIADRTARRPYGRRARAVYGADDAHSFLWEQVLSALALHRDDRLLDAGCGGGAFLRHVLATVGCEVAGVDHSRDMVRLAREKTPAARIEEADVAALPFADGEFTAVSSIAAFFHFADAQAALGELHRVLDPERGRIAILTASPESKGSPAAPYPIADVSHFYTDEELLALATDAGFADAGIARREEWSQLLAARP